jgi:hypothetical protein
MLLTGTKLDIPPALLYTGDSAWWLDVARKQKNEWLKTGKFKGDMPSLILPMRYGRLLSYVLAPSIDREYMMMGTAVCCQALEPDSLIAVMDGHIPIGANKLTMAEKVARGEYQRGDMQRACDNENACERGLYSDCMIVLRYTPEGGMTINNMTYRYDEKGTGKIEWTPEHDEARSMVDNKFTGELFEHFTHYIQRPHYVDDPAGAALVMVAGHLTPHDLIPLTRKEQKRLLTETALKFLQKQGFTVYDFRERPLKVGQ